MPLLDVTDLLDDPDFAGTFDLVRTTAIVDDDGVNHRTPVIETGISGVIQPVGETTLLRLADGSRLAQVIEIHTAYRLTSGAGTADADILVVGGAHYTVTDVADWTAYGAHFVRAIAKLKDLNP